MGVKRDELFMFPKDSPPKGIGDVTLTAGQIMKLATTPLEVIQAPGPHRFLRSIDGERFQEVLIVYDQFSDNAPTGATTV